MDALRAIGGQAPGGTLYVNLEPCNHQGRTPPCAPAVRASGVARVVVGTRDPIASHAGGIARLRRAKIAVTTGVLAAECERANLAFFTWARHGRPAFTLKAAITLDGKIATVAGESKWITGAAARDDVMRQRDGHDAVMVGINTVLADDPQLSARRPGARDPVRVVIDSALRTPPAARLLSSGPRTIIACGPGAPARREAALARRGAEIWRVGAAPDGRVDLAEVARKLAEAGLLAVLVEGGGQLHASLLAQGLADRLVIYVAPRLVGGPAPSWVGGDGLARLADAHAFDFEPGPTRLGDDLRLIAVRRSERR
ncbi:MAG TPA: bifunctional diaminohydroxyphosphoribosylaminopyrimidine deaminase/5-amino-6-(5-phosphoribosylamino)uracil reductase RibD [Kofleriaceae bacterium]